MKNKKFSVRFSSLYGAYAVYVDGKIIHGYDNSDKSIAQSAADRFQKEFDKTNHVEELGI